MVGIKTHFTLMNWILTTFILRSLTPVLICNVWASLLVQWLRIRLLMQGTRVRALVWEDPTCHGATKPVRHNY